MTPESPLRAQPDSRILTQGGNQYQGSLFDEAPVQSTADHEQLLADYRQRYGLAEDPFADDYSFPFFTGGGRRQLLERLLHLCQFSNSVMVVLGEYGVGKSRLAHALMDSLPEDDGLSYLPIKARQTTDDLLAAIVDDLELMGEGEEHTRENLLANLEQFILVDPLEDESLAVVVIDNAQLLSRDSLQVLADLIKKHPKQNRLHLVLFGEPPLMEQLEQCDFEGVLINDFYLQPFTLGESVDYLNFRMEMADYLGPEIFTESMVSPWWRQAQGQLTVLHECAQERLLESVTPQAQASVKRGLPVLHIVAISVLITLVGVVFLYMGDDQTSTQQISKPKVPVSSTVASTQNLTSTATPVEPLMQTLPGPGTTTSAAAATQTPATVNEEERIVPLAELSSRPATMQNSYVSPTHAEIAPAAAPATTPEVVPATNQEVVSIPPVVHEQSKPVVETVKPKPAPVEIPVVTAKKSTHEQTILGWPSSYYTIQLLGVSNEKAARDYIAAQANKNDLLVFKSKRQGKDWFVVIAGRYPGVAQARQAITTLPASQREAGPWPREVKAIQQEIKSAL